MVQVSVVAVFSAHLEMHCFIYRVMLVRIVTLFLSHQSLDNVKLQMLVMAGHFC